MYNQLAADSEDLRSVMRKKRKNFLDKLIQDAGYPVDKTFIAYGELSEHILERYVTSIISIWWFAVITITVSFREHPARRESYYLKWGRCAVGSRLREINRSYASFGRGTLNFIALLAFPRFAELSALGR